MCICIKMMLLYDSYRSSDKEGNVSRLQGQESFHRLRGYKWGLIISEVLNMWHKEKDIQNKGQQNKGIKLGTQRVNKARVSIQF